MMKIAKAVVATLVVLGLLAGDLLAGEVPVEVKKLAGSKVTLHVQPFLDATELKTLRMVATNKQALQIFVPSDKTLYSALAVSPDEGFIREGLPVDSAMAIGNFADAATAIAETTKACDAKKKKQSQACVVILETGPAK